MNAASLPTTQERDLVALTFKIALWIFVASMVFSVAGSLLVRLAPSVLKVFGPVYVHLVKAPTWTYMALLPVLPVLMYGRSLGAPLTAFFVLWGSLVGGLSELVGTTTGFPFGAYHYGIWLGPKLLGHVPYFIPFSWFAMSILSLDLARRLTRRRWARILTATLLMVLWDVALDPAMSRAFPFWTYPDGGFFFGMPASNWAGWFGVSLVIVAGYEFIGGGLRASSRWAPLVYFLNGAFPLSISLVYGLYTAFLIGAAALALPLLALWRRGVLSAPDPPAGA